MEPQHKRTSSLGDPISSARKPSTVASQPPPKSAPQPPNPGTRAHYHRSLSPVRPKVTTGLKIGKQPFANQTTSPKTPLFSQTKEKIGGSRAASQNRRSEDENRKPSFHPRQIGGHVFISQGYVSELACDAFWLSCDRDHRISEAWLDVLGQNFVKSLPSPTPAWLNETERVMPVHPRPESNPKSWRAKQWVLLVNFKDSKKDPLNLSEFVDPLEESLALYEKVIREFVQTVVKHVGTNGPSLFGRPKKLIGIPLAGTSKNSDGVLKNHVGRAIQKILPLLQESAEKYDLDFVLGTGSGKPKYAAVQSARARDSNQTKDFTNFLSTELMDHGKRLAKIAARGELALFIGAGVSTGCGLPLWKDLLHNLAQDANMTHNEVAEIDTMNAYDAAKIIEQRYESRDEMLKRLGEQLRAEHYTITHTLLSCLPCREAITTNYDTSFERASLDTTINKLAVIPYYPRKDCERWLLKMHGCVTSPSDIVLTREDYIRYSEKHQALAGIVQSLLITKHMLFIGFSLVDDNFHKIMDAVRRTHSSRHDLNDPQVRATVARAYAGAANKHEKIAKQLNHSEKDGKSGTILSLYPHPLMDTYWREQFDLLNMTETELGPDNKSHLISDSVRVLEIFLDYVAFEVSKLTMVDNLLLPNFENTLNIEERMARYAILNLVESFPQESLGTIAWQKVHTLVQSMGGRDFLVHKENARSSRHRIDYDCAHHNSKNYNTDAGSDIMSSAVLKYDHFEKIHRLVNAPVEIAGAPNFRKIPGFPVFGTGQPSFVALTQLLTHIRDKFNLSRVLWMSLRQEAVIYIKGITFAPRRRNQLNANMEFLNATRAQLTGLQEDLLQAVRDRLPDNGNTISYFRDTYAEHPADRKNIQETVEVTSPNNITTTEKVAEMCQTIGFDVHFERFPIRDETAPSLKDFDGMVQLIVGEPLGSACLFNCQMGKGRTTCGTVVACLVHQAIGTELTKEPRPPIAPSSHPLANGMFDCVKQLLKLQPNMLEAKKHLDDIVDLCGPPVGLHNLRECISQCKESYDVESDDKKAHWLQLGRNFVQRYITLICFAAYVRSEGPDRFLKTFVTWMDERLKIKEFCLSDFAQFKWT